MGNSFSGPGDSARRVSCPLMERQDSETMKNQETMQKMPIPTLAEVCEMYIATCTPLLSAAELEGTKKCLESFQAKEGPALYEKLKAYDEGEVCWVEKDYQNIYLSADCSNYSLNPSFVLEQKHDSQSEAAADFCCAALEYHHKVRTGTLEAWATRAGPLCMKQLPLFFASARIASKDVSDPDESKSFLEFSRHIVFIRNGLFYSLTVLNDEGEMLVDKATLIAKVDEIRATADAASGTPVGALTTASRTIWSPTRARLTALSPENAKSFETIDSALFVVCLDSAKGLTAEKMVQNVMYGVAGTTHNRWLDKWSLIVCEDGQAGINWEHSSIDGQTMQEIIADIGKGYDGGASIKPCPEASKIAAVAFTVDAEATAACAAAAAEGVRLGDAHGIATLEYKKFGANFIKTAKCSPDGFLQAAMMMAWKKYKGFTPAVYESVLTKAFKHGRVFVARNTNQPIADALDAQAAGGDMKVAVGAIAKEVGGICKLAAGAKDIDRPFLVMKAIAKKEGITIPVFDDPSWKRLGQINLCTSHCGKPPIRFFCFEAVPDGFGIGYNANPDGSQWNITHSTDGGEARKFAQILSDTLDELHAACS